MRRAPVAWATAAVAVCAVAGVPPGAVAHADEPNASALHVAVTSPEPDAPVRGLTPVTVHVEGDGTLTPHTVTVVMTGEAPVRTRSASAPVGPECAISCDVTVEVDTQSWQDPGDDPGADASMLGWTKDYGNWGLTSVVATVDADGPEGDPTTVSSEPVSVRVGSLVELFNRWPLTFTETRTGTASFGQWQMYGTPVRLVGTFFGNGVHRDVEGQTPVLEDGLWRMDLPLDVTGLPDGVYHLRVVTIDSEGIASRPVLTDVGIYSGTRIRGVSGLRSVPPTANNGYTMQVTVDATVGPYYPFSPHQIKVAVDGAGLSTGFFRYDWDAPLAPFTVAFGNGDFEALSPGPHRVSVEYSETVYEDAHPQNTRYATATWEGTLDVAGVRVTPTVVGPVVEATSGTLKLVLAGAPGTGVPAPSVKSWRVTDGPGGKLLGSGSCTPACASTTTSVSLTSLRGGVPALSPTDHVHPISIQVTDSDGLTRTSSVNVGVDAKLRVGMSATKTVAYGGKATLTAYAQQSDNAIIPGVPITFQTRTAGTTTWRTFATVKTNSLGRATTTRAVTLNTQWRAVVPARVGYYGAGTTSTLTTAVPAKVTLSGVPATGYSSRTYTATVKVLPASSRVVYVQVRKAGSSTWSTLAKKTTDRYGVAKVGVKRARGTWHVRVYVPGVKTSAARYTSSVKTVMR